MALTADASGNQTFTPDVLNDQTDILSLAHPRGITTRSRPPTRPRFTQPKQVGPNLWLGSVTWFYASGALLQEDDLVNSLGEVASSDLICDDWGIMRHAFLTNTQGTPDPSAPDRVSWADFHAKGQNVIGFYDPGQDKIYVEDPATGLMSTSSYAPWDAAISGLLCMQPVMINGSPFLALGWSGNSSSVSTFEIVDKLSAGYSTAHDGLGQPATWGIAQSPVAGNPILTYRGTNIWAARAADVALGSTAYTKMLSGIPEAGYFVGQIALGNTAYMAWAIPQNGTSAFFNPTSLAAGAGRLKIILTDLYGFYVSELHPPLPFVRYVNVVNGSLFMCDGHSHYYLAGAGYTGMSADYIAVDRDSDWAANSDRDRVCRGHAAQNDRALWVINEVASPSGTGATKQWFMEYDTKKNIARQISKTAASTFSGEITAAGPSLPVSSYTNLLHVYTTAAYAPGGSVGVGTWHSQYQPPASVRGYSLRHTAGSQAGTGQEFEAVCDFYSTVYRGYPGFEGCPVAAIGMKAPPTRSIANGGTGSKLIADCAGMTETFSATELPTRPARKDNARRRVSFGYDLQLHLQSYRTTTDTDATRFSGNVFPFTVDLLIQSDAPPLIPANSGQFDRSRSRRR